MFIIILISNKWFYFRLGRPGVEWSVQHGSGYSIVHLTFVFTSAVAEPKLISITADDTLHLWSLPTSTSSSSSSTQLNTSSSSPSVSTPSSVRRPELVQSLKFVKERITSVHLPLQSKWMYIGTDRGNVHVLNVESFALSGYVIYWNKAIDWQRKSHPGLIVHLSDCPSDASKLLVGYDSGLAVLWDLKARNADARFTYSGDGGLRSICWSADGRQFIASHTDGSLSTWDTKSTSCPLSMQFPHCKYNGNTIRFMSRLL